MIEPKTEADYEADAERVIEQMRGGNILAVSPDRSTGIIKAALMRSAAAERERCAKVAEEHYAGRDEDPLELAGRATAAHIRALE